MKIVLIGAGLGGVATAYALTKAGHEVELYEQADELRKGGYGVVLWPNATGILDHLGMDHTKLGHRLDQVHITSETGQTQVRVELDRIAQDFGAPNKVVRRSELVEALAGQLPPGVLRFGACAVSIEEPTGGEGPVGVTFADGRRVEADLLIGADGYRSSVRRHLFGHSPVKNTGWATWHGTTPLPIELTSSHRVQTMAGEPGLCVMHPLGEGQLYWAFETLWNEGDVVPPAAPGAPGPKEGEKPSAVANLRSRFAGFSSPLPELLDSITDDDVHVFPHILHEVPKQWGRGPITLLGDSVHAVPPRTGMGANQALEDAWVISRVLAGPGSLVERLRRYEKIRYRRTKLLYHYAVATGKQGQSVPGLFKKSKQGISFTGFQRFQIKAFSTYLNAAGY